MCPSRIKALWIIWMPQRGARLALSWKGSASRALGPQKTLSRVHSQSKETQRASQRSAREYVTCAGQEVEVKSLSCVWLYATPWTVAYKTPLSMEFSRQEYWSGWPFSSPGGLPDPGIEPRSPALQADALPSELPGKSQGKGHSNERTLGSRVWFSWFYVLRTCLHYTLLNLVWEFCSSETMSLDIIKRNGLRIRRIKSNLYN